MTSITKPERIESVHHEEARRSGLVWAVWILALVVVGLAAWLVYAQFFGSETAATGEVEALLEDYNQAWNDSDGTRFLELVTDEFEFEQYGVIRTDAERQAAEIDRGSALEWRVEQVGELMMQGTGPWYVASANKITTPIAPADGYRGISVFTIVEQDGVLLIHRHVYIGRA